MRRPPAKGLSSPPAGDVSDVCRQPMVIDLITTSVIGRSPRAVGVVAMASTTAWLAGSVTSPKMECRRLRCGVGPTVMKNWLPLVPGPRSPC